MCMKTAIESVGGGGQRKSRPWIRRFQGKHIGKESHTAFVDSRWGNIGKSYHGTCNWMYTFLGI